MRTMRRLHAGRELAIDTDVSPAHEIRGLREDLDEMLENLLDSAPESPFRQPSTTPNS